MTGILSSWAKINGLGVNPGKTELVLYIRRYKAEEFREWGNIYRSVSGQQMRDWKVIFAIIKSTELIKTSNISKNS